MQLKYSTRDAKGNDFVKNVEIKEFPVETTEGECGICHKHITQGIATKKAVSSHFTDWNYVGDWMCPRCAQFLSLYKYSYIVEDNTIQLLNIRQIKDNLLRSHKTPNLMVITTSQKKHLFYKSTWNYSDDTFAVNLEEETIYTSRTKMKNLFLLIESLVTIGASKQGIKDLNISFPVIEKIGLENTKFLYEFLRNELKTSREIQIPLYCGQKLEIEEETAICNIISILRA